MYGDSFDADWTPAEMDPDEAVDRMFALGVAAVLDTEPDGERERLLDVADTQYERSMLDLSYEEGQQKARGIRRDPDRDADDPEAVWETLVAGTDVSPTPEVGGRVRDSDLPDALAPAELLTNRVEDDPSVLDVPEALRRD